MTTDVARLLDLFCGPGGAATGYARAGFEVTGVDLIDQPHYPYAFIRADAMAIDWRGFDVVHASPPCQDFTSLAHATKGNGTGHYLEAITRRLESWGGPYVVENVEGAPLAWNLRLCGESFGLEVVRHRLFRTKPFMLGPRCCHQFGGTTTGLYVTSYPGSDPHYEANGRIPPPRRAESEFRSAIGCEWMTTKEARQAVPPAYTHWIGGMLLDLMAAREVVSA